MSKVQYYTEEGLKKLKDELHALKTKGRIDIAHQIAEARDKGDLSENAEYDAAKDAQGLWNSKSRSWKKSLAMRVYLTIVKWTLPKLESYVP